MISIGNLIFFLLGNFFFLVSLLTFNLNENEMKEIGINKFEKLYYSTYFALISFILIVKN